MKTTPNGSTEIIHNLPLDRCLISDQNTRHPKPTEPGIIELAQSMKGPQGQTTPGIVREHPKKKGFYEIGAGARRRIAAELAQLPTFAAVIRPYDDDAFEELILVENFQREDPDPRAEIKLLDRIVKRGITTASAISAHLGKPEHWVAQRLKLLSVIPELRKEWEHNDGRRGLGIYDYTVEMVAMLGSLSVDAQKSLLAKENNWYIHGNHLAQCDSAADLKRYLSQEITCLLSACPFDLNDKRFFVKGCGPGCASDSSKQENLFGLGGEGKDARCLNCACFQSRLAKFRAVQIEELRKKHEIKKNLPFMVQEQYSSATVMIGSEKVRAASPDYNEKVVKTKPEKGEAQQVYVVSKDGNNISVGYVVKGRSGGGSSKKSKPKVTTAEGLKERKKILTGRRWNLVREALIDLVLASTAKMVTVDVVDLIPAFGTSFLNRPDRWTYTRRGSEKPHNPLWDWFDGRKKKGWRLPALDEVNKQASHTGEHSRHDLNDGEKPVYFKDRNEAIWHALKPVLIDQLMGFRLAGDIINDNVVFDIERVGKLIKFDTAKAKKEADLTIRPPKSWGKVDVHTLEPIK